MVNHSTGWILALAALVSGPATAGAVSAFGPGEQSTYRVRYLGLEAGTAQITVGAQTTQWGAQVLPIVTLARSSSALSFYPIRDRFVTYWDPLSDRCVGSELNADENRSRRRQRIRLDHEAGKAIVVKQKEGGAERTSTHDVDTGTLDIAAATFALRNKPLDIGRAFEMPIFTGTKRFMLKAMVESKEMLPTALGEKETFRVRIQTAFDGKLESKRDLLAWITTDEARIPVRLDAEFALGTLRAELADYKGGRRYSMGAPQSSGGSGDG